MLGSLRDPWITRGTPAAAAAASSITGARRTRTGVSVSVSQLASWPPRTLTLRPLKNAQLPRPRHDPLLAPALLLLAARSRLGGGVPAGARCHSSLQGERRYSDRVQHRPRMSPLSAAVDVNLGTAIGHQGFAVTVMVERYSCSSAGAQGLHTQGLLTQGLLTPRKVAIQYRAGPTQTSQISRSATYIAHCSIHRIHHILSLAR